MSVKIALGPAAVRALVENEPAVVELRTGAAEQVAAELARLFVKHPVEQRVNDKVEKAFQAQLDALTHAPWGSRSRLGETVMGLITSAVNDAAAKAVQAAVDRITQRGLDDAILLVVKQAFDKGGRVDALVRDQVDAAVTSRIRAMLGKGQ